MSNLKSCPFCGAKAKSTYRLDVGYFRQIIHARNCYFNKADMMMVKAGSCFSLAESRAWNRREPDWESRYAELVEDVSRRTDQNAEAKP